MTHKNLISREFKFAGLTESFFYSSSMTLSDEIFKHTRKTYDLLELSGDFGGLLIVLTILCSTLIAPWAAFKFEYKAIQKLFMVHTNKSGLFETVTSQKHLDQKQHMHDVAMH